MFAISGNRVLFHEVDSRGAQVLEALMNNPFRRPNKTAVIVFFSFALLLAASVALVTSVHWRPTMMMMSANPAPPNGTPGSAQPGTIGLARPHVPLPMK